MKKFLLMSFSLLLTLAVFAQERVISGRVTSADDGSPLPGVNVIVKGTTLGTVTDADGKYSISTSAGTLVFTFIGLRTQEVAIGDRSLIDIRMESDVTQLTEIVVTGTGVATEKRKLAIAVESVSAEKLPQAPTASVDQALVGKIAGAQISSVSGNPGAQVQILLRGINSVQRGTQPMILVDGVQMPNTSLNTLDLSSVENVEVVQGAAAASIYGAQGANGVIQIFTRKGKKGKTTVDVSTSIAQSQYLNIGGLRMADRHAFETDANGNVVVSGTNTPLALNPLTLQFNGGLGYDPLDPTAKADKPYVGNLQFHDHFKEFFKSAVTSNASIRISGGGENSDFSISVSNNHQESNVKNGGYNDRTNLTSNIGTELAKGLSLRSITQLAYTKNTVNNFIYGVFNTRPFVDFNQRNTDGLFAPNYGGAAGVNGFNPNYFADYTDNVVSTIDVIQSLNLNYKPFRFLELDTKYGLNWQNAETVFTRENETANRTVVDAAGLPTTGNNLTGFFYGGNPTGPFGWGFVDDVKGEIDTYNNRSTFHNWISKASINLDLAKDLGLSVPIKTSTLLVWDWRRNVNSNYTTSAAGFPADKPFTPANGEVFRVEQGGPASNPITGRVPFVTYGYMINQRIEYGELFGLSGGFRSDYSSAFGKGSKPFTFPRGDAYFRVSALDFWDNSALSSVFLEWKLRAAYGQAGIQPFAFDRYVTVPATPVGSVNGYSFNVVSSNPNLNVEVSTETEIGTDMTFNVLDNTSWLNNITASFTYWKRSTDNAIWNVDAAPSSGVGQIKTNAFGLESRGIQASLSTRVYKSSNLTWNLTMNYTKATSEITSVLGGEIALVSNAGSTGYVLKAGQKIGQLYGYLGLHAVDQVNPATSKPYIDAADQGNYTVASNGWVVDKNTKQPYFTPDQYSFGDPNPKFNMSFINDVTFKGFLTIGVQIDWLHGNKLYNQTKEWMYRDGIHSDYNTPISINGETGAWTAFYRGVYAQVSRNGTKNYFLENASFARLRNVSVAVDFAKVTKLPFRTLQLVFTGRNLFTITKYTGMDPEVSSGALNSAWDRGVDHNSMPNFKSYQLGLNIGF